MDDDHDDVPLPHPARQDNRPPDASLVDVPGLLLIAGLVGAGLLIALAITGHLF